MPDQLELDEIYEDLVDLDSAEDRLEVLIELGQELEELPEEERASENQVLGCQSMVWLVPKLESDRIYFRATSDAPMVRGLIAVLSAAYNGKTPQEILEFGIEEFFDKIQLRSFISPMRSNGLNSIIARIKELAVLARDNASTNVADSKQDNPSTVSTVAGKAGPDRAWRRVADCRTDFPFLHQQHPCGKEVAYLDNAASSQRPASVIDAMSAVYQEHYSNVHRSGHHWADLTTRKMEDAREAVRSFVNANSTKEVVFTSGTTAAINLVARSWGDVAIQPDDEILLTEMEHHSNIVPWQQLAAQKGATIRWVPITADYQIDIEQFQSAMNPRVKLVAMSAVSNVLGTINPVQELVAIAHEHGAAVLVDAAQAAPHGGLDVANWDADFVVFSGHKILGPSGIGVLFGKQEVLESMPPFLGGGNMIRNVTFEGFEPADLPHRFEAGTGPITEVIGLGSAIEYLGCFKPIEILEHERKLTKLAEERLRRVPNLKIFGPSIDAKVGIITFTIPGIHPDEIGRFLDANGVAVRVGHHCAMPLHDRLGIDSSCRASFYIYNTEEDVERFVSTIERIAKRRA